MHEEIVQRGKLGFSGHFPSDQILHLMFTRGTGHAFEGRSVQKTWNENQIQLLFIKKTIPCCYPSLTQLLDDKGQLLLTGVRLHDLGWIVPDARGLRGRHHIGDGDAGRAQVVVDPLGDLAHVGMEDVPIGADDFISHLHEKERLRQDVRVSLHGPLFLHHGRPAGVQGRLGGLVFLHDLPGWHIGFWIHAEVEGIVAASWHVGLHIGILRHTNTQFTDLFAFHRVWIIATEDAIQRDDVLDAASVQAQLVQD
mmetsp:Transcript_26936/g.58862  ORF Transcript_26936/g.58862 Transcript_26936/m.58862 type:complete len:253 (-) Transcript_26936:854-1612(-)